jgi:hypothetical protein
MIISRRPNRGRRLRRNAAQGDTGHNNISSAWRRRRSRALLLTELSQLPQWSGLFLVSTQSASLQSVGRFSGQTATSTVLVTVTAVVAGAAAVIVHAVIPQHEHALLYSVPVHALAYPGMGRVETSRRPILRPPRTPPRVDVDVTVTVDVEVLGVLGQPV